MHRTSLSLCGLLLRIPHSGWLRTTCEATFCINLEPKQYKVGTTTPSHNPQLNISPEWLYLAVASTRAKALYMIIFTCYLSFGPTGLTGPTGKKIWPVGPNPSSMSNIPYLEPILRGWVNYLDDLSLNDPYCKVTKNIEVSSSPPARPNMHPSPQSSSSVGWQSWARNLDLPSLWPLVHEISRAFAALYSSREGPSIDEQSRLLTDSTDNLDRQSVLIILRPEKPLSEILLHFGNTRAIF